MWALALHCGNCFIMEILWEVVHASFYVHIFMALLVCASWLTQLVTVSFVASRESRFPWGSRPKSGARVTHLNFLNPVKTLIIN